MFFPPYAGVSLKRRPDRFFSLPLPAQISPHRLVAGNSSNSNATVFRIGNFCEEGKLSVLEARRTYIANGFVTRDGIQCRNRVTQPIGCPAQAPLSDVKKTATNSLRC